MVECKRELIFVINELKECKVITKITKMEASKESISVRVSHLNSQVLGRNSEPQNGNKIKMDRESLLDALTVLYDECNTEALKKSDKFIASFVDKFKTTMLELRKVRVNISDFEVKNIIGRGHFGVVHVSIN